MRSRLLFFSLPNSSHHGLNFSIPCLPYSISSLHGRESKQLRLPPSGFSISVESLFSRNPIAASIRLHLGRRLSSSSSACLNSSLKGGRFGFCFDVVRILNPRSWRFGCIPEWGLHLRDKQVFDSETGNTDAVVQQFKEPEGGGRVYSTSVLNLDVNPQSGVGSDTVTPDVKILMAAKAVDWRPKLAMAVDWGLQSAVVGAGQSRWLFWAWASPNQMWASVCELTSAGMPWLARVSAWAVEAFGLEGLQSDYGPVGAISIGNGGGGVEVGLALEEHRMGVFASLFAKGLHDTTD